MALNTSCSEVKSIKLDLGNKNTEKKIGAFNTGISNLTSLRFSKGCDPLKSLLYIENTLVRC